MRYIRIVLSIAILCMATTVVYAQRGRGAPAPGRPPAYNPAYRSGYRPPAYNYSTYRYPYNRGYYPGYAYPSIWYAPTYTVPSYYYAPSTYYVPPTVYVPPTAPTTAAANIRVIVPDPQAMILFNGQATTSTGMERFYHTSPLQVGFTYTYTIRATWMEGANQVAQDRVVSVMPGETVVVDFRRPAGEIIRPPED